MAVSAISSALMGMQAAGQQIDQVAERVSRAGIAGPGGSDTVDISTEAVQLLSARTGFELAARVARIANDADQTLLDLLA